MSDKLANYLPVFIITTIINVIVKYYITLGPYDEIERHKRYMNLRELIGLKRAQRTLKLICIGQVYGV